MNQKPLLKVETLRNEMMCPLCNLNVRSDADLSVYCKLCGMYAKDKSFFVKRNGRKFVFCSELCKHRFLKLGFRSFKLYKSDNHGML